MKNILFLFTIFELVIFSVFGQGNVLYEEIQQAKASNIYFENAVLEESSRDFQILTQFINSDEVFFFDNISLDITNKHVQAINLTIPLFNKNMFLELLEVPEYFYDYIIETSDGQNFYSNRKIKHYRGIVKDESNSLAAITFYENEIMGLICTEEGNFNIVKEKQTGKHLFYNNKNMEEKPDFTCNTVDDRSDSYDWEILFDNVASDDRSIINKMVRFYVETDYSIYQNKGSVAEVEMFITGLYNQVAILYYNATILTNISTIFIWNSTDPYINENTTAELLEKFQEIRTSINGDLGMLLTFRNVGGGRAVVDGLCKSSTKNKLGVAAISYGYNIVPEYSWSVLVVTHESGHQLGSKHTHACVWNGNNTAIDGCGITAGYSEGSCANPGHPIEGGTIMSYCHLIPYPYIGINFNLGFGPQPGNVIRNKVSKASCLEECLTHFTHQTVTSNQTIRGCDILNVEDVTITNNATVRIFAYETVELKSGFFSTAGTDVRINTIIPPTTFIPPKNSALLTNENNNNEEQIENCISEIIKSLLNKYINV